MSYEQDLITRARELQRLLTKRRRLRRNIRAVEQDIRHVRKVLKALQHASEGRRPDIAPSRLDAGTTGYVLRPAVRQTACALCDQDIENFAPYPVGEWRDRGNNTHCNDGRTHEPIKEDTP